MSKRRQLVEKSIEQSSQLYVFFVDLKDYDSVSRHALWNVLRRMGVPARMLRLLRSLYDGMQACDRVSGVVIEEIPVTNGLRHC